MNRVTRVKYHESEGVARYDMSIKITQLMHFQPYTKSRLPHRILNWAQQAAEYSSAIMDCFRAQTDVKQGRVFHYLFVLESQT